LDFKNCLSFRRSEATDKSLGLTYKRFLTLPTSRDQNDNYYLFGEIRKLKICRNAYPVK